MTTVSSAPHLKAPTSSIAELLPWNDSFLPGSSISYTSCLYGRLLIFRTQTRSTNTRLTTFNFLFRPIAFGRRIAQYRVGVSKDDYGTPFPTGKTLTSLAPTLSRLHSRGHLPLGVHGSMLLFASLWCTFYSLYVHFTLPPPPPALHPWTHVQECGAGWGYLVGKNPTQNPPAL